MKKVVLLTGTELRHEFFRKYLSNHNDLKILSSYCESKKGNLQEVIKKDSLLNDSRLSYLYERDIVENDFFDIYSRNIIDKSNPIFIERGEINDDEHVNNIIKLKPDIIVSYGCSIIRSKLLTFFNRKFINIHLGLSPYYRGSGTNFWPFVNNELQFVGTTFMHIDQGVDTGEIIHQIRADMLINDNIHQIGNRLIRDSVRECLKLILRFDKLEIMHQITFNKHHEKYFRKRDFTKESLITLYNNISKGIVKKYLENKTKIDSKFIIIKNDGL